MPNPVDSRLYPSLLDGHTSLEEALSAASARIAAIGRRNTSRGFRSVNVHGASITLLYDYELPTRPAPAARD